jgi:hypothetical protein
MNAFSWWFVIGCALFVFAFELLAGIIGLLSSNESKMRARAFHTARALETYRAKNDRDKRIDDAGHVLAHITIVCAYVGGLMLAIDAVAKRLGY